MRKTKEEAAVTRQLVLDAALAVFSQKGYAATKLDDIATHANLTRGAIYWHFKNKTDLYLTLVREVSARLSDVIASVEAQGGSTADILSRLLVETCGYIETDEQFRRVTELTLFKTERLPELEDGMQMKVAGIEATTAYLATFIRRGILSGEFRRDLDAQQAALTLTALQNGLVSNWLLCNGSYSLRASSAAAAAIYIQGIS